MPGTRMYEYWLPTEEQYNHVRASVLKMVHYYRDKFNETGNYTYFKVQAELEKLWIEFACPDDPNLNAL